MIFAHFDSVDGEDTSAKAPGCEDTGSGVAALLLVAEAVAEQAKITKPRRSVVFVAFQAEEEGLVGSNWFTCMVDASVEADVQSYSTVLNAFAIAADAAALRGDLGPSAQAEPGRDPTRGDYPYGI